jgi:hypothetical protein
MRVSEVYGGCSVLPSGGSPASDAMFCDWLDGFVEANNAALLDCHPPGRLPARDPLPSWRLINHLLKTLHDSSRIDWKQFNHRHRIRALAIRYADRPALIVAEAERYVRHLMTEIEG